MLKKKMFRDIWDYKVQFLSIFLMAFIGVFVFTGLIAETNSFEYTVDTYYADANLADGWIYSDYLIDEFLDQVYLLGATTQMERQLVVDSQAKLDNDPAIMLHFVESNSISKFYLLDGEPLNISDSEGVWLDKSFANARNLKVGDTIAFESHGIEIEKVIRGIGYSPEYVIDIPPYSTIPNYTDNGYAYLSYKAFPSDNISYNVLNVKFEGSPETYSKLLDYRLDGYYSSILPQSSQQSVNVVSNAISEQNALSYVFPPIFILISMLMLLTTMKRIITNQRTQIGILKANGFSNKSIRWHYLLSGFLVVTLASVAALVLGPTILHMIVYPIRSFYFKFPYWNFVGLIRFVSVVAFMGLMSLLVSYLSIRDIVNESPSAMIRPKTPKMVFSDFIESLKIWNKFSFNIRWNYRDAKRNRFRSVMAILGVIGCTVLLITGFGIYEQMENSKAWYFDDVNHYESKLVIDDDASLSQIDSVSAEVNGDEIMESSIEISEEDKVLASLMVLNGTDLITITDNDHNRMKIADDEVSISQKMADILGVGVGDTIDCHIAGSEEWVKVKIDKIHASPFSQGLVMSPNKLEQLGLKYTPTNIISSEHVNKSYDGIKSIIYRNEMVRGWDEMEQTSMLIITALLFFAVVLAVVILYNMNMLSFIEMENDIATLKVLGFESRYLTKILATQSLFFIIIGFILGIPIAYYILSLLMYGFGDKLYLVPSISLANLLFSFIIILAVSIVMILYFSRKILRFDMVEYLKSFE